MGIWPSRTEGHLIMFLPVRANLTKMFSKSQIPGGSPGGGMPDRSWNRLVQINNHVYSSGNLHSQNDMLISNMIYMTNTETINWKANENPNHIIIRLKRLDKLASYK